MNNAEIASNGQEVYTHRLLELCDEYVESELRGNEEKIKKRFRDMIFFISDRIQLPDRSDVMGLENLFYAYVKLCCKCERLPTMELFAMLCKIDRNTFNDWRRGEYRNKAYFTVDGEPISCINTWRLNHPGQEYREVPSTAHSSMVEKIYGICRGFAVDELSNSSFANPNLIFVAKAAYGLRETSPLPAEQPAPRRVMAMDELPFLGNKDDDTGKAEALPYLGDDSEGTDL